MHAPTHPCRRSFAALASLIACLGAGEAGAADLYARALVGAGFAGEDRLNASGTLAGNDEPEFSTGLMSGAAFGVALERWRFEGEVMYRRNGVDEVNIGGNAIGDGDIASLGLGVNVLYEFNLLPRENVRSYIGGGLVYLEEVDIDLETAGGTEYSYSDSGLAGQFIAGARYALGERWELFAEYRYLHGGSVNMDAEEPNTGRIETDYNTHSLSFGVGWRF